MDNGGREAMLYDLLNMDLSGVNLRNMPQTEGLFEQKLSSADSVMKFWYSRLFEGWQLREFDEWLSDIPTIRLHEEYIQSAKPLGFSRIEDIATFSRRLRELCPKITGPRRKSLPVQFAPPSMTDKRANCLNFPSLEEARKEFEKECRWPVQWPEEDEKHG
jgi:hypothetical protein